MSQDSNSGRPKRNVGAAHKAIGSDISNSSKLRYYRITAFAFHVQYVYIVLDIVTNYLD